MSAELRAILAALRQDVAAIVSNPMIPATVKGAVNNLFRAIQLLADERGNRE